MHLYIAESTVTDPYANIAREAAMTDCAPADSCTLYLWQNDHTVVIGKNQNPLQECRLSELYAAGGKLARRFSGGGAVYHDLGNLNFSFIAPAEIYDVQKQTSVILEALGALGIPAEVNGRNDLTVQGRKFSGHAYFKRKNGCCHHGTIMVGVSGEALSVYLRPDPEKLKSKGVASVRSRVTNLSALKEGLTVWDMKAALVRAFETVYGGAPKPYPAELLSSEDLQRRREELSSESWLYRGGALGQDPIRARFPWGGVTLYPEREQGLLTELQIFSDGMDAAFIEALAPALRGSALTQSALWDRVRTLMPDAEQECMARDLIGLLI